MCIDYFKVPKSFYNTFDIILEYTFFCAIPISKRNDYIRLASSLLKKNGKLICIFIPITKDPRDDGPPYGIELNKTLDSFKEYFYIKSVNLNPKSIKPRYGNEAFVIMIKK